MFEDGTTKYVRGPSLQESKIEPEPSEAVKYFAIYALFVYEQTDQTLTYGAVNSPNVRHCCLQNTECFADEASRN